MQIVELLINGSYVWSVRTMEISYSLYLHLSIYSPVKLVSFLKFSIIFVTFFKEICL